MAAVLVHIDLDGDHPHPSSMQALAAGRVVASSWGATLYAAVVVQASSKRRWPAGAMPQIPGKPKTVEAIRLAIVRGGADKIVVALTDALVAPLWGSVGGAWQGVLDRLRPRVVLFGADAPSATELGPRTGARIGARLFLRGRVEAADATFDSAALPFASASVELRDREGGYLRMTDSGAAVVLVGAAPQLAPHGDEDLDVMVLEVPDGADPRVELVSSTPAELAHATAALVAIDDDAAKDAATLQAAQRLARAMGAPLVSSDASVGAAGAVHERNAALGPELLVAIGAPAIDVAGATSLVRIGSAGGKGIDGALAGDVTAQLGALAQALEGRR